LAGKGFIPCPGFAAKGLFFGPKTEICYVEDSFGPFLGKNLAGKGLPHRPKASLKRPAEKTWPKSPA